MAATPLSDARKRARAILAHLQKAHPDAGCALEARNAFELLIATILSAQCTDARVNEVTPDLFAQYSSPEALARGSSSQIETLIRPTGFYRSKARSIIACATALVERHEGRVPCSMEALIGLPGVGRKTANVVLGHACGVNEGVVVDTHVLRVSGRLGLSASRDPAQVEADLQSVFPRSRWTRLGDTLIFHGRRVCHARKPACDTCPVASLCPSRSLSPPGPRR